MLMKKLNLLYTLIVLCSFSCSNTINQGSNIPNDSLVNVVIRQVLEIDSISKEISISKRLCPYTLDYSMDQELDKPIPPPPPNQTIINPISPKILWNFLSKKIDISLDMNDTTFISQQISKSEDKFLINDFMNPYKLVELNYHNFRDYFRNDSIIIFYYPIFTSDRKYVYVNYHFQGHGIGVILKNDNVGWKQLLEFDTWNK
jgi:hypothetical protein